MIKNSVTVSDHNHDGDNDDEYFMRKSLEVAKRALDIGEVPVGCVIVLDRHHPAVVKKKDKIICKNETNESCSIGEERRGVVISHGANQVNATRDATRHAEVVAIDRLLTDGVSSDKMRLPPDLARKGQSSHAGDRVPYSVQKARNDQWEDRWINEPSNSGHWTNSFGWRNNFDCNGASLGQDEDKEHISIEREIRSEDIFRHCDLYVTCEPCIMCAAALATVGIRKVIFGCKNDRFGGCGSILHLHQVEKEDTATLQKIGRGGCDNNPTTMTNKSVGYEIKSGVLEEEAITLLRSFYDRENFHAPDDKRRRKDQA